MRRECTQISNLSGFFARSPDAEHHYLATIPLARFTFRSSYDLLVLIAIELAEATARSFAKLHGMWDCAHRSQILQHMRAIKFCSAGTFNKF